MVLTVSFALSPVIGLVVTVIRKVRCGFNASVEASRPRDFAVRFRAVRPQARKRPSHPALHVRDDRDTPL
jgi:hypothetical protein